ncbi:MAG: NAD(P)H-dependent oxidoreductase [Bacteroidales bacterium]|nr:NAD(P)H-dependent oxidoreductase [Bacteroidales bacterium]
MNQLIIIAHPRKDSFNYTIKNTLIKEFEDRGDKVKVRDLYKIKFRPILDFEELKYNKDGKTCPDIAVEQNYIEWANELTVIYPLWWNAFPAILKGYIDRVFTNGFAFKITPNGPEGMLKRKKVRLITSAGMDEESLKKSNIFEGLKVTQDRGVFEFCGMEVLDHIYITESTSLSKEEKKNIIENLVEKVYKGERVS